MTHLPDASDDNECGFVWVCLELKLYQTSSGRFVCSDKVRCLTCSSLLQIQGGPLGKSNSHAMAMAMAMAAMMQARPQGLWRSDKLSPRLP